VIAYLYVILTTTVLAAAVAAVLARSLLWAAIALGTGSVALAILFFLFDAPHAGGFELSVGAG
jgi:uncharacterized MnhB-related membrane protein